METIQIIALLVAERDRLNNAIQALQGPTKRIGRPPKNLANTAVSDSTPKPAKRKRRKFTAAQRRQQAERMKAFWAAKRKAEAKPVTKRKLAKAA